MTKALRLIDALLLLSRELHEENVTLRAMVESRLARIEAVLTPQQAPIVSLSGTRRNRAEQVLALLHTAPGPLRGADIARACDISPANAHDVLKRLHSAGQVEQHPDKTWTRKENRPMTILRAVALLLALAVPLPAIAQTPAPVLNPTKVIFEPSPDHAATEPITGQPMVAKYLLQIFVLGAQAPMTEIDLGKPTPLTALDPTTPDARVGEIVAKPSALVSLPVGVKHIATVTAQAGSGLQSGPSNATGPFGRANPPNAPPGSPRVVR